MNHKLFFSNFFYMGILVRNHHVHHVHHVFYFMFSMKQDEYKDREVILTKVFHKSIFPMSSAIETDASQGADMSEVPQRNLYHYTVELRVTFNQAEYDEMYRRWQQMHADYPALYPTFEGFIECEAHSILKLSLMEEIAAKRHQYELSTLQPLIPAHLEETFQALPDWLK